MKRRDFFKILGIGSAAIAVPSSVYSGILDPFLKRPEVFRATWTAMSYGIDIGVGPPYHPNCLCIIVPPRLLKTARELLGDHD